MHVAPALRKYDFVEKTRSEIHVQNDLSKVEFFQLVKT